MPINLKNLLNILQTKVDAADSNTDATELLRLQFLSDELNQATGTLVYKSFNTLPDEDSGNIGSIVYVEDPVRDTFGSFYFGTADSWSKVTLTADSDEPTTDQNISKLSGPVFQGTQAGFTSGGLGPPAVYIDTVEKFSFTSDGNATDFGDLSVTRYQPAGQSSADYGYASAGYAGPPSVTPAAVTNVIDKFPFASGGTSTDVGDASANKYISVGQSSIAYGSGYISGGFPGPLNVIESFPFASDTNASDYGDLTSARYGGGGNSSSEYGYTSGGATPTYLNTIDKFPFVSSANATDVGDLVTARRYNPGQSSTTDGYTSGGDAGGPALDTIDKFPFASDANATDVGNLSQARSGGGGQSSTTHGYVAGGATFNIIDKFPFSVAFATATDVGDLLTTTDRQTGHQY